MIDKVFIGQIIKKFREKKYLTQEMLAEKVDISKNHLSKIERGICVLNTEMFLKIAEVLDFSLSDFGINQSKISQNNHNQEKLINMILTSSPKKIDIYLKALNFVDEIL